MQTLTSVKTHSSSHELRCWFALDRTRGGLRAGLPIFFCVLLLALTFNGLLHAETKLAGNSPFLPPGYGEDDKEPEKPVVQPQGPISREVEFRGIIQMDGEYQISVYNKKKQRGYWLKEDETEDGLSVKNFDPESSTVIVNMNGRSEQLTLMAATESPMPVTKAKPQQPDKGRIPVLPRQAQKKTSSSGKKRRVVPRRRVILPKKK